MNIVVIVIPAPLCSGYSRNEISHFSAEDLFPDDPMMPALFVHSLLVQACPEIACLCLIPSFQGDDAPY